MKNVIVGLFLLMMSVSAFSDYDNNFTGKITQVLTYTDSDQLLIRIEGQPTSHPICSKFDYMAVDTSIPAARRQVVLSRILLAYAMGNPVNIGYDGRDECIGARIKIYRIG